MKVKVFYILGLLTAGDMFKGIAQTENKVLSPTAEIFIVKKWLQKIDSCLPAFIQKTR